MFSSASIQSQGLTVRTNVVIGYSANVFSTIVDALQAKFDETFMLSAKEDALTVNPKKVHTLFSPT